MEYKTLTIKGAILNQEQLEKYLEKIATDHNLQKYSSRNTYPIPRLEDNFEVITEVYNLLNENIKLNIPIHPAGEWILDNYYVIDKTVKNIKQELSLKKYKKLLGLSNSNYKGFARIYVLASEIVNFTNNKIESEKLKEFLKAYQTKKSLSMDEIWTISIFLNIAIIENIREICEKIYNVQIQKYKAENIIERLVENKEKNELKFDNLKIYKEKVKEYDYLKYPFIEYLSYKLKKYGKKAYPFINVLEEEVNKLGTTLKDVVQKEHFDIALRKIEMANCITSIKTLERINMSDIFEEINGVEDILKKDPAKVYELMDYNTKESYRNEIKKLSNKTKLSEIYIANKCLEICNKNKEENEKKNQEELDVNVENNVINKKKEHIGYYLISNGKNELLEILTGKKYRKISNNTKLMLLICINVLLTIAVCTSAGVVVYRQIINSKISNFVSVILTFILSIILFIPTYSIFIQIMQNVLGKIIKPKTIPKLDYNAGVPSKAATFIVIPTIVKSREKVKEIMKKLEVFYMANKSENIYFALLGDCTSGKNKEEKFDKEVIEEGIKQAKLLNEKYPNNGFQIFHFIYRERIWNEKEECYLGWERKRGLLNQFNEYILKHNKNEFLANTINQEELPNIKYVITLDSDTDLVLNSGLEMIGAMSHILNVPELNNNKDLVIDGHALIQPRVGISLEDVFKSKFSQIYGGNGGKDAYTNAISDIYQDNFEEGIFTGKGIYDVEVFSTVLNKEIKENTVLSHDLLEGSYLRCGLATDIIVMDGFPTNYLSYKTRIERWVRGDWQVSLWLKKHILNKNEDRKENPLNLLSKYKILDNLLRSKKEIDIIKVIIYVSILQILFKIKIKFPIFIVLISTTIPMILEILNKIIYRKEDENIQKIFLNKVSNIKASISRFVLALGILPDKAVFSLKSISKTIYRMNVSKKHFLEWTTAEDAEKIVKKDLKSYYLNMKWNVVFGLFGIINSMFLSKNIICFLLSLIFILWLIMPYILWKLGKEVRKKEVVSKLNDEEKKYVLEIARKTWKYFKDYTNEKTNYLPPDNYQEDRKNKIVFRTSSTNIGLGLLAVVSAYDLKFESLENCINLLEKMINTILILPKWNGHLYNWYDLKTLQPLYPRYVSTVDSGNFIGYIYVLKMFLENILENTLESIVEENENGINNSEYIRKIKYMINAINKIINNTDFKMLYDKEKGLFSIGYNVEDNILTNSYYDLLASEARQASLVAISKKDIPAKHWNNLSRTLTILNQYKGLISWSGTAFEYWMPNINIRQYPGSLLSESSKFMYMCQKEYAKKLNIPWGISEAAFYLKDLHNNYQYKAFGIPWVGLKRGLEDEIVVSPYSSMLMITEDPKDVIKNLKRLDRKGMNKEYGFYESIDYTPSRIGNKKEYEIVKTYMAHHQGLILLSINNLFNSDILQKRFMENPEIKAVDILLQEKMPENVIITKEKKEKVKKIKYTSESYFMEKTISNINTKLPEFNLLSNENYLNIMDSKGKGYSKYKDILINKFKITDDDEQGINFFFKNIKNNSIWTSNYTNYLESPDKYLVKFSSNENIIKRIDSNIETTTKISIAPEEPIELRKIELKNNGIDEEIIEITSFLEPILSTETQQNNHPAFNKMFLNYEFMDEINSILVSRRTRTNNEEQIYLGVKLYTKNSTIGDQEFEIDKEKFLGRNNIELPIAVKNSIPFTNRIIHSVDSIVSLRNTILIKPGDKVEFYFVLAVGKTKEEAINRIKKYSNSNEIEYSMELSKVNSEEENKYLEMTQKDLYLTQKILGYLVDNNPLKTLKYSESINLSINKLWSFGISGDLPIITVVVNEIEELEIVNKILKIYEYLRVNNVYIDLIFISDEKYNYESNIKNEIYNVILNKNLIYLQNIKGGIYIFENLSNEDIKFFEYCSKLTFYSQDGDINLSLKEQEEKYLANIKQMPKDKKIVLNSNEPIVRQDITRENLKYNNEYGGFSEDGKEYKIRVNKDKKLPTVWSHILCNKKFGTIVTEGMGGYTWYKNSRLNRITEWNNEPIKDVPSEVIYLKDMESKKMWSLGFGASPDNNDYNINYGFGYAKYDHLSNNLTQKVDVFVPCNDNLKVQIIELNNNEFKKRKIKLVYYIKPVLGEDILKVAGFLNLKYDEKTNILFMNNLTSECEDKSEKESEKESENNNQYLFVSCNEKIKSYTGNKKSFFGKGNIKHPDALNEIQLNNENSLWNDGIIAVEMEIEFAALENKKIILTMGVGNSIIECQDIAYKYSNIGNACEEYEKTKKYWKEKTEIIQVNTPLESMNIMLNGWLIYQVLASRMYGKTGYYQSGGAYGFRDQLQDSLSLKYISKDLLKKQIIKHSMHQFEEGDVEHWWHEENNRGIRTRFSDDRLWLVYAVEEYISFSGDYSILDEETPYLKGQLLEDGIDERYDVYYQSNLVENIYEHCKKAINISLDFGRNGLPKIGSGDWNDGFSTVGNKGQGESVWLGFFLYKILKDFIPICEKKNEEDLARHYEEILIKLKKALNTNAWDGRWYKRAFMDNGDILGTISNEECKIDSIAQSWSVISGAGDNDKKYISMQSLENHLVDEENGIIKLLDPPFDKSSLEPGYIKSYIPGTRENGGQYTHAAIWAIIAQMLLGNCEKAINWYRMINPIEHCRTKVETQKYKVEPYVISADVYGQKNLIARGGWTWYTGSASWMYETGIKHILGFNIKDNILTINPCIFDNWNNYKISYKYGKTLYNVKIQKNEKKIKEEIINIKNNSIELIDDGSIYNIYIEI